MISKIYNIIMIIALLAILSACGNEVAFKNNNAVGGESGKNVPCLGPDCGEPIAGSDLFVQGVQDNKVDILFVDDNSGSMKEEQSLLGNRFNTFINSLQDLDWQVGITTTDVSGGKYGLKGSLLELYDNPGLRILTSSLPNADMVFKKTIERPETGSGNEQPLYASILAMEKRDSDNAGFFRNSSDLAIVILSDEDEASNRPSYATEPRDVVDKFESIWGTEKKLFVFGIVVKPGDKTCYDLQRAQTSNTAQYGTAVAELSQMTGGELGSICDSDYSDNLQRIGEKVRELVSSFQLAHVPIAGSVSVALEPAQNISWRVDGNKIIFTQPPVEGTRIDVNYFYKK